MLYVVKNNPLEIMRSDQKRVFGNFHGNKKYQILFLFF